MITNIKYPNSVNVPYNAFFSHPSTIIKHGWAIRKDPKGIWVAWNGMSIGMAISKEDLLRSLEIVR